MHVLILSLVMLAPVAVKPQAKGPSIAATAKNVFKALIMPSVATESGKPWPDNGDEGHVWDEPGGRIPTSCERGRTCANGSVSPLMPSPWGDILKIVFGK